jgi:hypothetical protein
LAKGRPKRKPRATKAGAKQDSGPQPTVNHRITVEAQEGRDTLASERWRHTDRAPTVVEVLDMLDQVEKKLSERDRRIRLEAFAQARAFVPQLAASNFTAPPPL